MINICITWEWYDRTVDFSADGTDLEMTILSEHLKNIGVKHSFISKKEIQGKNMDRELYDQMCEKFC